VHQTLIWGPSNAENGFTFAKVGLDRIDSKLGYVRGNVQWIHKDLQTMKWDLPEDRFIRLCDEVSKYARLKRRKVGHTA